MSDKIKSQHLTRKAILYVRQSTAYQVYNNLESQKLQYAMEARLRELGWGQVEIIDEDLGRSAAGTAVRSGFERMVAQVCMGEVGAVCAREVSRFARNSREWQQLVEVCRIVDTLLIDQEAVYSPRQTNDRLLLGLKGTMNEYELDLLRQRAQEARLQKARRGEFISNIPIGFVKSEEQVLQKHPDERIRGSIEMVFTKFLELGSARQVFLWFTEHELSIPARSIYGDVHWRRPSYGNIHRILRNPSYAGTYAYGKTESHTEYKDGVPTVRSRRRSRDGWVALIPGAHEGYLDWETFERIQAMINHNRLGPEEPTGAVRRGSALLGRVLRCRRCGRMLHVQYKGPEGNVVRYACSRAQLDLREDRCVDFSGATVDAAVDRELLRVLEPAAIEAAILASQQQAQAKSDVVETLRRDLEAATYRVQRAARQYEAADPENRLVARELEHRWNLALQEKQALEKRISDEISDESPARGGTLEEFQTLAGDLESVWRDPNADMRTKKRILRMLIREIIVDIDNDRNELVLILHWNGGVHTQLRLPRRRRGQRGGQTPKDIVEAVRSLSRICNDQMIAGALNRAKQLTGHGNFWTRALVASLRHRQGIECYDVHRQEEQGWINLSKAALLLGTSRNTLRDAIERGEVAAERPIGCGPWILNRRSLQSESVQRFIERVRSTQQMHPTTADSKQGSLNLSMTYEKGVL